MRLSWALFSVNSMPFSTRRWISREIRTLSILLASHQLFLADGVVGTEHHHQAPLGTVSW